MGNPDLTPFAELRDDLFARSPESEARVAAKVKRLRPRTLADIRTARGMTQVEIAEAIGTSQPGVSAMEQRDDWLLSTVRKYAQATGGRMRLVIEYPAEEAVLDPEHNEEVMPVPSDDGGGA